VGLGLCLPLCLRYSDTCSVLHHAPWGSLTTGAVSYLLGLKLVGSYDVCQRHHFVPVHWKEVLWNVLKSTGDRKGGSLTTKTGQQRTLSLKPWGPGSRGGLWGQMKTALWRGYPHHTESPEVGLKAQSRDGEGPP
jgi:hypothetical protein